MKRFMTWVMVLCTGLAAPLLVTVLIARAAHVPNSVQAVGFDQCEGLTCFLGIKPGITAWDDARTLLSTRMNSEPDDLSVLSVLVDRGNAIVLHPSIERNKVGRIAYSYVPYAQSRLTAGALIEQYGRPCGISVYYEEGIVTLRYSSLLANVLIRGQSRLSVDAPVYQLQLSDPAFHSKAQPDPCLDNITGWKVVNTAWGGFASVRHYTLDARR